jgi:SAM-dependent methyltransferase
LDVSLDRKEIGLLLLIDRLRRQGRPLRWDTLVPFAEIKLPRVAKSCWSLVASLREKGVLEGDADAFTLTPRGDRTVARAAREHSLHAFFYDAYYEAAEASAAHALFCERAYGQNLCQHGVADMNQIQLLIDLLGIDWTTSLLDFGCGGGQITSYIAQRTGAPASGIDIAPRAIALAQARTASEGKELRFYCGDILTRRGALPSRRFDRITAIDSFFFLSDQRAGLKALLGYLTPGGRMGIFYLCPAGVEAADTSLGVALAERQIAYQTRDLTAETVAHWRRKQEALRQLKEIFYAEGSEFLFKNRLADCEGTPNIQRYLYLVKGT